MPERGAASLAAGCDCVLHCNGDMAEMAPLMEVAGRMSAAAQVRAEAALGARTVPAALDIDALRAEREVLLPESA